jgi:acetyl-CoA carboxylase carboxyltransferase component
MSANRPGKAEILAEFFDDGAFSTLFSDGPVSAAYGSANGQAAYVVYQDGSPLGVKDIEKNIHVLKMAAQTGNPVVTFYDSIGAKLEGGLELLSANSNLTAQIACISGVVPQIAVVAGVCAGSAAIQAAAADVCIVADGAELFLNAPFTSEDKLKGAGTAAFAAKAGVESIHAADAKEAAALAAKVVGMMPANNLEGPSVFDFTEPETTLNLAKYDPKTAAEALADADSAVELYAGYGKNVYTALATLNGTTVGLVATGKGELDHPCAAKASRFVRMCDAYSIPLVTLVDTEGFVRSESDDEAGGIRQAARVAGVYAEATTAKVAILAGKAIGPVYTVFAASADWRIAVNGCTVAPLSPETAVSVLYKDEIYASNNIQKATQDKAAEYARTACSAAAAVEADAADLAVDASGVRAAAAQALDMLASKRAARLAKKHGNITL